MPDEALSRKRRSWGRTTRFPESRPVRASLLLAPFPAPARIVSIPLSEAAEIGFV